MDNQSKNKIKGDNSFPYKKIGESLVYFGNILSFAKSNKIKGSDYSISHFYANHISNFFSKFEVSESFINSLSPEIAMKALINLFEEERPQLKCQQALMDGNLEESFRELENSFRNTLKKKIKDMEEIEYDLNQNECAYYRTLEVIKGMPFEYLFSRDAMIPILNLNGASFNKRKQSDQHVQEADNIMEEVLCEIFQSPRAHFYNALRKKDHEELGKAFVDEYIQTAREAVNKERYGNDKLAIFVSQFGTGNAPTARMESLKKDHS